MGKRSYVSDGADNWIPIVSSLPNMAAYATTEYVDGSIDNLLQNTLDNDENFSDTIYGILGGKLDTSTAASTYLTQSTASSTYATKTELDDLEEFPIKINLSQISSNYTIPTGYNGISSGPIIIAEGTEVTISNGSTWAIA